MRTVSLAEVRCQPTSERKREESIRVGSDNGISSKVEPAALHVRIQVGLKACKSVLRKKNCISTSVDRIKVSCVVVPVRGCVSAASIKGIISFPILPIQNLKR
jgi:hypothetical protein